jgi:putative glutamine amidotransferase
MSKIVIGVTDCSKYDKYANWILAHSPDVEVLRLGSLYGKIEEAKRCRGILFTGGEDVHPRFYNKPEYLSYCHQDDVNEQRDEYELGLMEYTEKNNVPVMGICRGLQLFNVFLGGTLIPDIPSWGKEGHGKLEDGSDYYHSVILEKGSWLAGVTGESRGMINSNHHQSVDSPAPSLLVNAVSVDGVVEGVERKDPEGKGFLCLVQWHPERMIDPDGKFTLTLRNAFMKEVLK